MYYKTLLLCLSILEIVLADDNCHFDGTEYSCNGLQLNRLNNPHQGRVIELDITNSNLLEIPENAFMDFPSIRILDLENNNIEKVADGAFNGLSNLRMLVLGKNNLTSLSLSAMPKLQTLFINHNKISSLDLSLSALEVLFMGDNLVTNLRFLEHSPKLEELHVEKNRLSCVDEKILRDLPLKKVKLGDNPWQKGCGTAIFASLEGRNVMVLDRDAIKEQE